MIDFLRLFVGFYLLATTGSHAMEIRALNADTVLLRAGVECLAVGVSTDMASIPTTWMAVTDASAQYHWPAPSSEQDAACAPTTRYIVAKNGSYTTRPLKSAAGAEIGRITIGAQCEATRLRDYSATNKIWGIHFAIGGTGIRGLTVCEASP